jgi:hypothetical protein
MVQALFEAVFYAGPFFIRNAEIDSVADPSGRHDHVIAEDAFLLRADPQNCRAGFGIEGIGLQLDTVAAERFKGVAQQQVLGFSVHAGSLPLGRYPSPADLDTMMGAIDVAVAGGADYLSGGSIDLSERQGSAGSLLL